MTETTASEIRVTEADQIAARRQIDRSSKHVVPVSLAVMAVLLFLASALTSWLHPASGASRDLLVTGIAMGMVGPFIVISSGSAMRKGRLDLELTMARERMMREE
jgi:hypothetical protein